MSSRKLFIIDTSVLLYDKLCIDNFKNNDVVIPMIVLEELDRFKSREGILGENSRYFNRLLDEKRSFGSLSEGIYIEKTNLNIVVESRQDWSGIETLDRSNNDNIIISNANFAKKNLKDYENVVVITKDINLRVKCDAAGIDANDYYADYEFIEEDNLYKGYMTLNVNQDIINMLYANKYINIHKLSEVPYGFQNENEFFILKANDGSSASVLCVKKQNVLEIVKSKSELSKLLGLEPKNKEQVFALELLTNEDIPLVTLTGVPGSGKTYLTLMSALKDIEKEKKKRIIFTRPIQTVGKDIGFLPGTLNEKMAPWLAPIVDNFRNQFGDLTYFDLMMEKGTIDIAPLSYIRGRSFNDAIIIVDEAQNATVHELKTVITRTGKNSKIVLLGDIEQVDLPYIDKSSNGLTIIIEKLKHASLTGHVNFEKGYRSDLANIAAKLL